MKLFEQDNIKREKKEHISEATFIPVMTLSVIAITFLVGIWSIKELSDYKTDVEKLEHEFTEKQKSVTINEVENAFKYIKYLENNTENTLKKTLKNRVDEAYHIASNIYERNKSRYSKKQIINLIKDSLYPIRFNSNRGYYFIDHIDGYSVMNVTDPKAEGKNILDYQDARGNFFIRKEFEIAKTKGSGYFEYYWRKPGQTDATQYPKTSYLRYFKELGLIIGTGEYMDNVTYDMQLKALERMSAIHFGEDGYLFVNKRGNPLLMGWKFFQEEKKISDKQLRSLPLTTEKGDTTYFQDIPSHLMNKNQTGGFYYYNYKKPTTNEVTKKFSYILYFKEWDWTIGAGVYLDALDDQIATKRSLLINELTTELFRILSLSTLLIAILWWRLRKVATGITNNIQEFATFFDDASKEHVKINKDRLAYAEFDHLAGLANKMLDDRETDKKKIIEAYHEIQTSEEELRQQSESLLYTNQKLEEAMQEVKAAQVRLINSEKMASLGQLTAGIAHEINNPINFVSSNVQPLKDDIEDLLTLLNSCNDLTKEFESKEAFDKRVNEINDLANEIEVEIITEEIKQLINGIEEGALRTKEIVLGLRTFSRLDEDTFKYANINEGINSTLTILNNKAKKKNAVINSELQDKLPDIECLPGRINQVFMNIINNAIQAVDNNTGIITIKTSYQEGDEHISISIKDNGVGMPQAVIDKIFEPFFTTKDVGEGTGLGLSISYGIIQKHGGEIMVASKPKTEQNPESYTEFTIHLPIVGKKDLKHDY
ncbi:sensor histidine kinase [Flammeovirga kamogawensis]|uniref:histidine kinase n=1 Tax=Flammeovirga kamogawensis TaxID=373891 RepID=A0ABX8GTW8_9BACT|nr:cache domain-containing protein [Flammeovirga kamogawensis]MBB6459902.1 signal transduction histidine kinase [Flammeovirga kamogawensis]QWG07045.1 cache domain-containing protein [Flammeovirga kamogawensis]